FAQIVQCSGRSVAFFLVFPARIGLSGATAVHFVVTDAAPCGNGSLRPRTSALEPTSDVIRPSVTLFRDSPALCWVHRCQEYRLDRSQARVASANCTGRAQRCPRARMPL